jgi:LAS superfamily LD-carboxypeptidase LdcB
MRKNTMHFMFLTIALAFFAMGMLHSLQSRKKERWNLLDDILTFLLYFASIGCLGLTLLKWPEGELRLPDMSGMLDRPAVTTPTEPTEPAATQPTTAPTEPVTQPATEPVTEPVTEPTVPTTIPEEPGWHYGSEGLVYYIDDDGSRHTGFLKLDGETFYFNDYGEMQRGEVDIDGKTYHFAARGQRILLVNPWNAVPDDYVADVVKLPSKYADKDVRVDRSCYDALIRMLDDCNRESPTALVVSGYRTHQQQTNLYNNKVNRLMETGLSKTEAKKKAATAVAVPGTSEHQLGLAVDIIDASLYSLERKQETLAAQQWLMENSWKYGFVLRYPEDREKITGIIYEPWHYRYVGTEVARELYESGLTLEEYIEKLTTH